MNTINLTDSEIKFLCTVLLEFDFYEGAGLSHASAIIYSKLKKNSINQSLIIEYMMNKSSFFMNHSEIVQVQNEARELSRKIIMESEIYKSKGKKNEI